MYRNARFTAADMLDQIVVQATVYTADWRSDQPAEVESFATQVNSTGEQDSKEWLRDALIALLETL